MDEIRRIRAEQGLSRAQVAERSGLNPATINRIERGAVSPTVETLERVAEALECEVSQFFPKAEPSLFDSWRQRRMEFQPLYDQVMKRAEKYAEEVEDEESPHFANANSGTLWLERVKDELAMWTDFTLQQVGPTLPQNFETTGWRRIGEIGVWGPWFDALGPLVVFDAVIRDGERRIEAMQDKPDELAARRLARATAASDESREKIEKAANAF